MPDKFEGVKNVSQLLTRSGHGEVEEYMATMSGYTESLRFLGKALIPLAAMMLGLFLATIFTFAVFYFLPVKVDPDYFAAAVTVVAIADIVWGVIWLNRVCAEAIGKYGLSLPVSVAQFPVLNIALIAAAIWSKYS